MATSPAQQTKSALQQAAMPNCLLRPVYVSRVLSWPVIRATLFSLLFMASLAPAGEFNEVLSVGDRAPEWADLPGTDGQQHSFSDLKTKEVIVVAFTCASCPTAVDYEQRIARLATQYSGKECKVAVVAICVNRVVEDRLPALTERVIREKLPFHFLYDETQQIARQYGAIFTPEFFVIGPERKIVYQGAFDDSTDSALVQQDYVTMAVTAALRNELPATSETIGRGCRIRYAPQREPRQADK